MEEVAMPAMRNRGDQRTRWILVRMMILCIGCNLATRMFAQSLTWLGALGGGSSQAFDLSSTGEVVVGETYATTSRAFRWTCTGGMTDLGTPTGAFGEWARAYATSSNGNADYRRHRWQRLRGRCRFIACPVRVWANGLPSRRCER